VFFTQRSIALVVETAVWQFLTSQKFPHIFEAPIQDRKDPLKVWPASRTWSYRMQIMRARIGASIAHKHADGLMFVQSLRQLSLEVLSIDPKLDFIPGGVRCGSYNVSISF
jgi:hypothetical protein